MSCYAKSSQTYISDSEVNPPPSPTPIAKIDRSERIITTYTTKPEYRCEKVG